MAPVERLLDELDWLAAAAEADDAAEDDVEDARLEVTVKTEGLVEDEVEVVVRVEDVLGRTDWVVSKACQYHCMLADGSQ